MQPAARPRLFRLATPRGALTLAALVALAAAPAASEPRVGNPSGLSIGNPWLSWFILTRKADGLQDTEMPSPKYRQYDAPILEERDPETIPPGDPEIRLFINEGATTFWVEAAAPAAHPSPSGEDPVAYQSKIEIWQSFEKLEPDARLFFNLTGAKIVGLDPSPANDQLGPEGELFVTSVMFKPGGGVFLWEYAAVTTLTGVGREWELSPGVGFHNVLPFVVTDGSLDEPYVELQLEFPVREEIDLSEVDVGESFTFSYTMYAHAEDSWQLDTGVNVWGRDPLDAESGAYFEFTGLEPTDDPILAPEPGRPALLLAGAAILLGLRAPRRRAHEPGLARRLGHLRSFPITRA